MINLRRDACMTPAEVVRLGTKHWWWILDTRASKIIKRGWNDATDDLAVTLPPGAYLLGAGPPDHYRENIEIGPDGVEVRRETEDPTEALPCITPACAGVVPSPGSPCEALTLAPPDDRLCSACKGTP